jgi:hypothetical protein
MSATPPAGRLLVGAGFALGLAAILAGLWWATRPKMLTTADAVWFLPVTGEAGVVAEAGTSDFPEEWGEVELLVEVDEEREPAEKSRAVAEAEELLAGAEADLRVYLESMQLTRDAIEEAVVMVREQKENFDYAAERFATLMPLVETGALEPLAASQIQSAYISARASLAQAKFLLGQARRDFGTEETRRRSHNLLQEQITVARGNLDRVLLEETSDAPPLLSSPGANTQTPPHGLVQAVFYLNAQERATFVTGLDALIYPAGARENDMPVSAVVVAVGEESPADWQGRVQLQVDLAPGFLADWVAGNRAVVPCRVVITNLAPPLTETPADPASESAHGGKAAIQSENLPGDEF